MSVHTWPSLDVLYSSRHIHRVMNAPNNTVAAAQRTAYAADHIVAPAKRAWGAGWSRLSDEQKEVEVLARFANWVLGSTKIVPNLPAERIANMWAACMACDWS